MCSFYTRCHGGCPFSAYANRGDLLQKDYYCEAFKMIFTRVAERLRGSGGEDKTHDAPNATVRRLLGDAATTCGAATSVPAAGAANWDQYSVYADVAPYSDYSDYVVLA